MENPTKCLVCETPLTPLNINSRTHTDICQKCYDLQIMIFKEGTKHLPYKPPSPVCDFLWLGEEASSVNKEKLKELGVQRILVVGAFLEKHFPADFRYLQIDIDDFPTADLYSHFNEITAFINEGVERKEGVLVHCVSGISRSASAVIAYFIKKQRWTYEQAVDYVKSKRGCIHPNSGFIEQLKKYEEFINMNC